MRCTGFVPLVLDEDFQPPNSAAEGFDHAAAPWICFIRKQAFHSYSNLLKYKATNEKVLSRPSLTMYFFVAKQPINNEYERQTIKKHTDLHFHSFGVS